VSFIATGEWSRWAIRCCEPALDLGWVTWQLNRDGVVVARGSAATVQEAKAAGGRAYRRIRRAAIRGYRGYI
jgi:hypothetical protein